MGYSRKPPSCCMFVCLFIVSTYEFSASQGVPKEGWFSGRIGRYRWNLPTSQEKSFPISELGPSIIKNLCSYLLISFLVADACMQGFMKWGPQNHPNSLIFNRETRGLRDPNFDSVLYMQSSKTIICVDHSTPLWEFIDTHHISFFSFHPDVGFRSLTSFYSKLGYLPILDG